MKIFRIVLSVSLVAALFFLQGCDYFNIGGKVPLPFKWVEEGNRLTYDLNTPGRKIKGYRVIEIAEQSKENSRDDLIFHEIIPEIPDDPNGTQLLTNIFLHVKRLENGLYTSTCFSCRTSEACLSSYDYLKVPAEPAGIQNIPEYACEDHIFSHDIIISADSVISVPLGVFTTVAINDTLGRNIKFWDEKNGLIRIDDYCDNADTMRLELSEKNY